MRIKKHIEEINESLKSLSGENMEKLKRFEIIEEQLKKIKIKVKNVSASIDEYGNEFLNINYELPTIKLKFDDNKEVEINEEFRAINLLDLISFEDMEKIQKAIDKIKKGGNNN